jgi:hypothetical protein
VTARRNLHFIRPEGRKKPRELVVVHIKGGKPLHASDNMLNFSLAKRLPVHRLRIGIQED